MKRIIKGLLLFTLIGGVAILSSCNDDESPTTASFTSDPVEGQPGAIAFTNNSVNATEFVWEFGDGNTSTDRNPTHTYAANDTYSVKLTSSGSGGSDEFTADVTVTDIPADAPVASFTFTINDETDEVSFTNTSVNAD
ncbi:MAG: PKD domain-containing protein, partial [Ekhidna sp.]|nr:PKD domain-containing protein [Ekhidna sp.]